METHQVDGLTVYRFESGWVGTNMYVLIHCGEALIVDPHPDEEVLSLLAKETVKDITVFLTHEHPDHTCGVPWLKKRFKVSLVCSELAAKAIGNKKNNRPLTIAMSIAEKDKKNGTNYLPKFLSEFGEYACQADVTFETEMEFDWHGDKFVFTPTPGHSKGSCCIKMNDTAVFTGDNLIWDTPVITRFPGGSLKEFNEKTKPYLDALPDDILVLAGHGRVFKMKEAR